jgi:hypothetical protein
MRTTIYCCDVKGCENEVHENENLNMKIQVIFLTEQTEGRPISPHLCEIEIDICDVCLKKVLNGNYLYATGAQGHNKIFFDEKEVK